MLTQLLKLLREAESRGETLSIAALAQSLGTSPEEVQQMLEILAWTGKVKRVESAGCSLEGTSGCEACPLNKICTRGVTHSESGYVLTKIEE